MEVIKATYGGVDCTEIINSKIKNNKLIIRSDNSLIGDVSPGIIKYLEVEGIYNGNEFKEIITEGNTLTYPKSELKKLGIFYSNNTNPNIYPAIKKSLDTIKLASDGKADIITCMWKPFNDNPFQEIISWYQSQSHLNQLLQILQILYTAKEIGNWDYVSFLEHDVMYPLGYFDFPEFECGNIITNTNYGGINRKGWQNKKQSDEPFHQMSMRFDDAISHCLEILPNALRTNSGMIESQTLNRLQWECLNQSIHINHGNHFTSHYSIYDSENTYDYHPYWGTWDKYQSLFF
jgi:hypothetical protein